MSMGMSSGVVLRGERQGDSGMKSPDTALRVMLLLTLHCRIDCNNGCWYCSPSIEHSKEGGELAE